jgi:predicted nucleic acid-binding protein
VDKNAPYLFDTNILLALLRGGELGQYINQTCSLTEALNKPIISIVSHGELWAMADRNNWGEDKQNALRTMLNDLPTIDLNNPSIIESYVAVDRANRTHSKGARNVSQNDLWIAATARAAEAVLLTTDKDFLHLQPEVCFVHYVDQTSKLPQASEASQPPLQ